MTPAEQNRARFPEVAKFIDKLRADFECPDLKPQCIKVKGEVVLGKEVALPEGWVRITAREWLADRAAANGGKNAGKKYGRGRK